MEKTVVWRLICATNERKVEEMRCTYANDGEDVGGQLICEALTIEVLQEWLESVSGSA